MFNEELNQYDIEAILTCLEIKYGNKRPDPDGWITIKSPLREDKNPSFGLNINTGSWKDHGTGKKGDIVNLVEVLKDMNKKEAMNWIRQTINSNTDSSRKKSKKEKAKKPNSEEFWTQNNRKLIKSAQKSLEENTDNSLLRVAKKYDQLDNHTLLEYGCGLINMYGYDWLAFPYETGCQLYRRDNQGKVIRNLKGSSPSTSFFGISYIYKRQHLLFICKSPRETMLMKQLSPQINAIGLVSGEVPTISDKQRETLKELQFLDETVTIYVMLDCDTNSAYKTAKKFTEAIQSSLKNEAHLINISAYSDHDSKDITELIQNGWSADNLINLVQGGEHIETFNSKSASEQDHINVSPDDLKLSESLIEKFPKPVQNYLNYSSPLSDVPNEFLLTPFLAIAAAAIGKKRFVVTPAVTIYPTIWTVIFAGSSTLRKSTAISLAKRVFDPVKDFFHTKFEQELEEWKQEKEICEENDEEFNQPRPIKRSLYCPDGFSDVTFWETLRDNQSIISTPTEFTALWNELNRPRNSMKDLALSLYDAENSIRRTTKNSGEIELNNPVWCIAGATTLEIFQNSLSGTERASGLLQRILPVCMEQQTKEYMPLFKLQKPDKKLFRTITEATQKLIHLEKRDVELTDEAQELHNEWSYDLKERSERLSDRITDIGGYESRLNVYGLKFALILQQLDEPTQKISPANMEAAITLCDWLFNHIIYMLDRNYIFNRLYADRLKLRKLIEKQPENIMTRTDLMNRSNFDKDQLDKAIGSDIAAGIIEPLKTDTAGRPLVEYKLIKPT